MGNRYRITSSQTITMKIYPTNFNFVPTKVIVSEHTYKVAALTYGKKWAEDHLEINRPAPTTNFIINKLSKK